MSAPVIERVVNKMPDSFSREYTLAEGIKPLSRTLFVVFVLAGGACALAGWLDNAIEYFTFATIAATARPLGRFIGRHRPHIRPIDKPQNQQ